MLHRNKLVKNFWTKRWSQRYSSVVYTGRWSFVTSVIATVVRTNVPPRGGANQEEAIQAYINTVKGPHPKRDLSLLFFLSPDYVPIETTTRNTIHKYPIQLHR